MTGHERENELSWLAFRYVAGELSADEQAGFEARLDTEQAAREAVAREVELAQAVAMAVGSLAHAGAQVTPAEPARRELAARGEVPAKAELSARTALFLAAAASLAIGLWIGRGWNQGETAKVDSKRAAAEALAGYWQPIEDTGAVEGTTDDSDDAELAVRDARAADDAAGDVPPWLLAALEPEEPADSPRREN